MAIDPLNDEQMILRVLYDAPEGLGEQELAQRVEIMRAKAIEGALFAAWARGEMVLVSTDNGGTFAKRGGTQ